MVPLEIAPIASWTPACPASVPGGVDAELAVAVALAVGEAVRTGVSVGWTPGVPLGLELATAVAVAVAEALAVAVAVAVGVAVGSGGGAVGWPVEGGSRVVQPLNTDVIRIARGIAARPVMLARRDTFILPEPPRPPLPQIIYGRSRR